MAFMTLNLSFFKKFKLFLALHSRFYFVCPLPILIKDKSHIFIVKYNLVCLV